MGFEGCIGVPQREEKKRGIHQEPWQGEGGVRVFGIQNSTLPGVSREGGMGEVVGGKTAE